MEQLVYTLHQTSDLLQISESTVRRRIKDGTIPRLIIGGKILIPAWWIKKIGTE